MKATVSEKSLAVIKSMQQNELTESVIYAEIAKFAKGDENKETLLRLSAEEKAQYPTNTYDVKGVLWEMFEKYPNLYGDISAGSAYRALSKDPKGYEFLQKFHKKICFGTDRFSSIDEPVPPIIGYLKDGVESGKITQEAYDSITHKNYLKLISES